MKRLEAGSAQQELLAADAMLELVREQSGLTFSGDRRKHALEVARRAIRRVETMAGALDARVGSGREAPLLEALVAELTVGETYFFREPEQLRFIRDSVLPALASRKGDGAVHVWSAGCATGEEPYSIAILLHELGLMPRASIVGTDISRERLAIAARGRYGAWSLRGVPSDVVRRHFDERDGRLTLKADRRRPVRFTPLNLAAAVCAPGVTHGTMDLVLCRNVLIYFDRPTIERVARLLLGSLSEDGWLFLGASDPLLTEMLPCEVVVTGAGVAYRRAGARAASARSVPVVRVPVVRVPVEPMIGPLASPPVVAPAPRPAAHVALAIAPPRSAAELADDARRQHRARAYEDAVATARRSVQIDAGQVGAWVTLVQSLANAGRLPEAGIACAAALDRHRTSSELLVLQSVLLASAGRPEEAALSARGALYLDRGSVMAWMTLGTALARLGEAARARHAFANAERLLGALAGDVEVAMADGETASGLRAIVRARLGMLDGFAA